jgi:hypothetical protein
MTTFEEGSKTKSPLLEKHYFEQSAPEFLENLMWKKFSKKML